MSNLSLRGMNVKKYALAMVMVVLLAAGYSQRSEAQFLPCAPTGTYAQLIGTICTIDDKLFGDFGFVAAPGTAFTAADLGYTVIEDNPCVPGHVCEGFRFNFGLTANSGQTQDFTIQYDILCITSAACIVSAELSMTGGSSTGGSASVAETLCLGSLFAAGCTPSTSLFVSSPGSTTAATTFTGVNTLGVQKDINASCAGITECTASISVVTNTVDQLRVPEPATLLLFGAGLAGLGWVRRRKAS